MGLGVNVGVFVGTGVAVGGVVEPKKIVAISW